MKLLAPLASDADQSVARAAIAALGKIGDPRLGKRLPHFPKTLNRSFSPR